MFALGRDPKTIFQTVYLAGMEQAGMILRNTAVQLKCVGIKLTYFFLYIYSIEIIVDQNVFSRSILKSENKNRDFYILHYFSMYIAN